MKLLRLALLAVSLSFATTACQSGITAPEPENGTWLGSGGQIAPSDRPNMTGTWLGSGG